MFESLKYFRCLSDLSYKDGAVALISTLFKLSKSTQSINMKVRMGSRLPGLVMAEAKPPSAEHCQQPARATPARNVPHFLSSILLHWQLLSLVSHAQAGWSWMWATGWRTCKNSAYIMSCVELSFGGTPLFKFSSKNTKLWNSQPYSLYMLKIPEVPKSLPLWVEPWGRKFWRLKEGEPIF